MFLRFARNSRRFAVFGAAHLSLVDDEQGGGVEAVRRLPLQHGQEAAQLVEDELEEVPPQAPPGVQVLVEGLPEALDGQAAAVVLVPAEVEAGAELVHLQRTGGQHLNKQNNFYHLHWGHSVRGRQKRTEKRASNSPGVCSEDSESHMNSCVSAVFKVEDTTKLNKSFQVFKRVSVQNNLFQVRPLPSGGI